MVARFATIGEEMAKELEEKFGVKNTPEVRESLAGFTYNYFRADCSDDYSVTLREQAAIKAAFKEYLISLGCSERQASSML